VSERRASLEKTDVQADPTGISGKADMAGCKSEDYAQLLHRDGGDSIIIAGLTDFSPIGRPSDRAWFQIR
jgi:hypothetical protein